MSLRFDERRACFEHAVVGHLIASEQPLHLLTGMPGNVGDHLIWGGTDDLVRRFALHPRAVTIAQVLASSTPTPGTLVVPGSEALNAQWGEWLPQLVAAASGRFDRVVLLPSGVTRISPLVQRTMRLENVECFARDVTSYRALRQFGRTALSMDCAVSFDGFREPPPPRGRPSTLLALRTDVGSRLHVHGVQPRAEINNDISATAEGLESWLESIRSAHIVVTDRLHVVVASVLYGRRTYFVEAYDRKIRSYVDFAFRDAFDHLLSEVDWRWLLESGFVKPVSDDRAS